MEKLIVARHGSYGGDHLNSRGVEEINRLSQGLQQVIGGGSVVILSSTAARAVESAKIMSEILGVPFSSHEILWSDDRHRENLPAALRLVQSRENEADVVVLVTHFEYAEQLPTFFGKEVLGEEIPEQEISKGQARVVDCVAKTCVLLRC
ncbi:MAG: hypothetical protein WC451_00945 [Patescibacteria group bacterium]